MSSEESREELEDGEKRLILIAKPILWRSPKVDRFVSNGQPFGKIKKYTGQTANLSKSYWKIFH